ncbi:ATP-binding protein [Bacteroidota bacterium]
MYITRTIEKDIHFSLENNPVVAIVGPRQCGKSTTAKQILSSYKNTDYLDLERPSDLSKLEDAEWYLSSRKNNLICIDEIQHTTDLFPVIRSLVDEWGENGKFLLLGSASRDLLQQGSESLAGRIAYKKMSPFTWPEIQNRYGIEYYLERGGFPKSIIPGNSKVSTEWRENFISTFLQRDLIQWAGFSPATMRRLWQMLAHNNGQTINYSSFGKSLSVSHSTIRHYIDLLESTFMVVTVNPYFSNLGKRLVKAPKVYIADSGITLALLGLSGFDQVSGHYAFGSIWEQIVLTNLKAFYPEAELYFYRTSNGAEIDFVMKWKNSTIVFECKSTKAPLLSKGNYLSIEDIKPDHTYIVAPVNNGWPIKKNIDIIPLHDLKNVT